MQPMARWQTQKARARTPAPSRMPPAAAGSPPVRFSDNHFQAENASHFSPLASCYAGAAVLLHSRGAQARLR